MPKAPSIESHWSALIDGLQSSPQDFYSQVEHSLAERGLPNTKASRVNWKEGGMLSAKREYLRIEHKNNVFDICAAPYGNGFFVSWWQGEYRSLMDTLRAMPWIGGFVIAAKPRTYYTVDTMIMFRSSVQGAVKEVIDRLTQAQGVRALSDADHKPQLKGFFPH